MSLFDYGRTKCLIFTFIGLSCSPQILAANDIDELFSLSLEELLQVEITGSTLTPHDLLKVPSPVTVFTHIEISRMGINNLNELMNLVPGFQSYRTSIYPSQNTFSSRGRRVGANTADVLVLLDGQRMDSPMNGGHIQTFSRFPLSIIERVEFIRGPGSAIYGSNAMTGVINIISRQGENELNLSYGEFNSIEGDLLGSSSFDEVTLDWFVHFDKDEGDDYLVQDTASPGIIETHDPQQMKDFNIKINWLDTTVNLHHYNFNAEEFYSIGYLSNAINSTDNSFSSVSLKQDFEWSGLDSWVWLSYQTAEWVVSGVTPVPTTFSFSDYEEIRLQQHNNYQINENNQLSFGVEYRTLEGPAALANDAVVIQTPLNQDFLGAYIQYQAKIFDEYDMTLGVRYDDVKDIGSEWSPRLGIVRTFNQQHSLKLLYAEAFRAPAGTETDLVNNATVLGNPDLVPENINTWDLIWLSHLDNATFSIGYFSTRFEDSIVRLPTETGAVRYDNSSEDPVKGYEIELSYQLNYQWLFRFTFTAFTEKPDQSFRESDDITSLMINYKKGKWNFNMLSVYSGERQFLSTSQALTDIDDYVLFDSKLTYDLKKDLQYYLQIKNMFDEAYTTPTVVPTLDTGVAGRGREVMLGLNWRY